MRWFMWLRFVIMFLLMSGPMAFAQIIEPDDLEGGVIASAGSSLGDADCEKQAFKRFSVDASTDLYFELVLDSCSVISYEVYSVLQGTSSDEIEPQELDVDDLICVWDEDATHGANLDTWTFTGAYEAVIIDDVDMCDYARVVTNDTSDTLNWKVYRVTVAGTFIVTGTGLNEHDVVKLEYNRIDLDNYDDVEDGYCVGLGDTVLYTVCLTNDTPECYEDVVARVYFDKGVTYAGADWQIDGQLNPYPPDPWYDPNTHSYVWELGEICENDSVCLDIEVEVNTASEPGMELLNVAELTAYICRSIPDPNEYAEPNSVITICGTELIARSMETTPVCCWGDYTAVYVDQYATGSGDSGTSWVDAYSGTDGLSKALYRATHSSCTGPYTIYIASGNYFPGEKEEDSFVLPEGTQIYGGFPSGGCDFSVRNPKVYEALLSGQVDDDWFSEINNIVTMGHNSLLDGVMITRAKECGIYGNTVNFSIKNCVIKENERYGVYALNGNVSIERCKIQENERDGIYHSGTNFTLDVTNSWVMRNGRFGVNCTLSTPNIKNSIVSESDMKEQGSEGVRIVEPAGLPVLYNNTIANNKGAGLFFTKTGVTDPNDHVEVKNCILYYNNAGNGQLTGIDETATAYCCIQGGAGINNNVSAAPLFAYPASAVGEPDPNNYRLSAVSPLKDIGCPSLDYTGQTDYDNEDRVSGLGVEIGADELHSCSGEYLPEDFANSLDFNADGLVNMREFQFIAQSWLTDPNTSGEPNDVWNEDCNLDNTGSSFELIDIADLAVFLEDGWLWQACWYAPALGLPVEAMAIAAMSENTSFVAEAESITALDSSASVSTAKADISTLARATSKIMTVDGPANEEEENMYAELSNAELALFVRDILDLKTTIQSQIDSGCEDTEDMTDIIEFFDEILDDVQETLQK